MDNDFSLTAWQGQCIPTAAHSIASLHFYGPANSSPYFLPQPCVRPYLAAFLPAEEAAAAAELFRSRSEKQAEVSLNISRSLCVSFVFAAKFYTPAPPPLPPCRFKAERMAKLGLQIEEHMGPEICNIYFSLAYGGKV